MNGKYILGLDIGTGSVKAVAVDASGLVVNTRQEFYPTHSIQNNWAEQDPDLIFKAFTQVIRSIVSVIGAPPAAISLSSAMHSIIVVNLEGKALTPLIIWSDGRSSLMAEKLRTSAIGKKIYEQTGTPLHSMSPLCKIMWLQENRSEVLKMPCKIISIKEYIWYQLFHEFVIDHSIASATGLFDITSLTWNANGMKEAGITRAHLSQPVTTSYLKSGIIQKASDLLGIASQTTFCIGASDGCLATLGTHALKPGVAALSIGTSGAVRISGKEPIVNSTIMNFNYLLDEHTYISGCPVNNGGNIVQWLLKDFLEIPISDDNYYELFKNIESIQPGSKGLVFLPYLHGERAPIWDEQSCGVFFGVRSHHSKSYFLRAAMEGTCYALKQVLDSLEKASHSIDTIHASGGFVHDSTWVQLLSDILDKNINVQQTEDASATGAAFIAMKSLGWIKHFDALPKPEWIKYSPSRQHTAIYAKNFSVYKSLYPLLKDSMHHLNTINT